jgi:hypothetical protein
LREAKLLRYSPAERRRGILGKSAFISSQIHFLIYSLTYFVAGRERAGEFVFVGLEFEVHRSAARDLVTGFELRSLATRDTFRGTGNSKFARRLGIVVADSKFVLRRTGNSKFAARQLGTGIRSSRLGGSGFVLRRTGI